MRAEFDRKKILERVKNIARLRTECLEKYANLRSRFGGEDVDSIWEAAFYHLKYIARDDLGVYYDGSILSLIMALESAKTPISADLSVIARVIDVTYSRAQELLAMKEKLHRLGEVFSTTHPREIIKAAEVGATKVVFSEGFNMLGEKVSLKYISDLDSNAIKIVLEEAFERYRRSKS